MRLFLLACIAFAFAIAIADGSFISSMYPRFKHYHDGEDPGDALYLTEYIEKNDIEHVSWYLCNPTKFVDFVSHPKII